MMLSLKRRDKVRCKTNSRAAGNRRRLQEGEESKETSGESTDAGGASGGRAGELGSGGRGRVDGNVAGSNGDLGLAVADLGDNGGGSGSGNRHLGLAIGDLRNDGSRSGCLGLTVGDLGDYGDAGRGRGLGLAIRDLGDNSGRAGLGLTVGDLSDNGSSGGGLRLAVGDLRNDCAGRGSLGLTIGDLGDTGTLVDGLDVDLDALCTGRLAVEVVEVARQALVEDSRSTEREGAVAAEREARSFTSASLDGSIELEPGIELASMPMGCTCLLCLLVVAGNVALATSLILQDTILEAQGERTRKLTLLNVTLR